MKRVISVLVENKFGVLAKVSRLFSSRGYNIQSLTVGQTNDATVSRMTIVVNGDERILDQVVNQLGRRIDVIRVENVTDQDVLTSELMFVKVRYTDKYFSKIKQIADVFKARIKCINERIILIEISGHERKIDNFIKLMDRFGIVEVVRSGTIAISRIMEVAVSKRSKRKRLK